MKKITFKALSVILSVMMLFGIVPVLALAEKPAAPVFSASVVEENTEEIILMLSLKEGAVACFDIGLTVDGLDCIEICTTDDYDAYAKSVQKAGGQVAGSFNIANGKLSIAITKAIEAPMDIAAYTFEKSELAGVNGSDVSLVLESCYIDAEKEADVTASADVDIDMPETHQHTPGEWVVVTEATCAKFGKQVAYCTTCGLEADSQQISKKPHANTYEDNKKATCTEDGYEDVYCSDCERCIKHKVIPALNHKNQTVTDIKATCTKDGLYKVVCDDCGKVFEEEVRKATGHGETTTSHLDATCTENGYDRVICTVCKEVVSETVIKAPGHVEKTDHLDAKCDREGYDRVYCSECGDIIKTTIIPKKAHVWSSWTVSRKPTYRSKGIETRHCINCSETQERDIPMLQLTVEEVKMSMPEITMNFKQVSKLYADVMPEDAAFSADIVWSTSDPKVCTVSDDGTVTATGIGTAVITASTEDGEISDTCTVTVTYSWLQWIIVYILFGWIWYV